jgi:hypothetical protein
MNVLIRSVLPAALILGLTGCIDFADFGDSDRFKEDFHYSYPLSSGGTVSLENANGSVEITGWGSEHRGDQRNEILPVRRRCWMRSRSRPTPPPAPSTFEPCDRPTPTAVPGRAITIHVPRKVLLDTITTTKRLHQGGQCGRKRAAEVHQWRDPYGQGSRRDRRETLRTERWKPWTWMATPTCTPSNGSIKVDATHGSLDATTSNGSITATLEKPATNWPVKLHSSNGHIDLTIRSANIPDVRADTSNSAITVHLPGNVNARVHAATTHSSVSSDFDVLTHGGKANSELDGHDRQRRPDSRSLVVQRGY